MIRMMLSEGVFMHIDDTTAETLLDSAFMQSASLKLGEIQLTLCGLPFNEKLGPVDPNGVISPDLASEIRLLAVEAARRSGRDGSKKLKALLEKFSDASTNQRCADWLNQFFAALAPAKRAKNTEALSRLARYNA